jgi:hypothetical protein
MTALSTKVRWVVRENYPPNIGVPADMKEISLETFAIQRDEAPCTGFDLMRGFQKDREAGEFRQPLDAACVGAWLKNKGRDILDEWKPYRIAFFGTFYGPEGGTTQDTYAVLVLYWTPYDGWSFFYKSLASDFSAHAEGNEKLRFAMIRPLG